MNIIRRANTLHLRRRVPLRYRSVESREFVSVSLKTENRAEAVTKAAAAWERLLAGWEAMLSGDTSQAEAFQEAARNLCAARGFRYLPPAEVAKLPLDQIIARAETIRVADGKPNRLDTAAVLGSAPPPITVPAGKAQTRSAAGKTRARKQWRTSSRSWATSLSPK